MLQPPASHYYMATIQYDGTGYAGFQWQKDIPSIQNDFNQAIKKLIEGKVTTMGASRTDTGVHALKQIVKVTSERPIEVTDFLNSFNSVLPKQIKCIDFKSCRSDFRPANDPHSKEYRYYFTNKRNVAPDARRFISNFPLPLNQDSMSDCVKAIKGTHSFHNFCSAGSNVKSTIRDISFCELSEINPQLTFPKSDLFYIPQDLDRCFELKIMGNGFLKQMIRHIVSALWMVGSGKMSEEDFLYQLEGPKKEKRLWKVAPANGLFLMDIMYPDAVVSEEGALLYQT